MATTNNSKYYMKFFIGFIITLFLYLLFAAFLSFTTFSFGGQTLAEHEEQDGIYFFTSLVLLVASLFIMYVLYKNSKQSKGYVYGIGLALLLGLFAVDYFGGIYFDNFNYHEAFNQEIWLKEEAKPLKMSTTLVKENKLLGKTRNEIKNMLGNGINEHHGKVTNEGSIIYRVKGNTGKRWQEGNNQSSWELKIIFYHNSVLKAYLYQEGLDL